MTADLCTHDYQEISDKHYPKFSSTSQNTCGKRGALLLVANLLWTGTSKKQNKKWCGHVSLLFTSKFSRSVMSDSDPMDCSMPGFPVHHQFPELAQTHVHQVLPPSHHLSSPSPAFNLSRIRVFSNESILWIRWPKCWSFSFSISPSNEYSGLISFRIDWLDPFAVQGTLKSLLQHRSSKASVLRHSTFFTLLKFLNASSLFRDPSPHGPAPVTWSHALLVFLQEGRARM